MWIHKKAGPPRLFVRQTQGVLETAARTACGDVIGNKAFLCLSNNFKTCKEYRVAIEWLGK